MVRVMKLTVEDLTINYNISGSGEETVVILQGWGTTYTVYDSIANLLGKKYRVVQFDLPGFGNSSPPPEPWNVEAFTTFFVKLMESLEFKKIILFAHSYGGRMVLKLFEKGDIPFEIDKLIMCDAAGIVREKTPAQKRKIKRYKRLKKIADNAVTRKLFPTLVEDWKSRQGSEDYRRATPVMRSSMVMAVNEDLSHALGKVTCETLLIWGDEDTATPLEDGQQMEREMPDAGLAVIKGAGHFCFLDQPVVFAGILSSYLKLN